MSCRMQLECANLWLINFDELSLQTVTNKITTDNSILRNHGESLLVIITGARLPRGAVGRLCS